MLRKITRLTLLLAIGAIACAAADARKKLVLLIAEPEYETIKTLPEFAAKFLAKDFRVVVVSGSTEKGENAFDKIDEVVTCPPRLEG